MAVVENEKKRERTLEVVIDPSGEGVQLNVLPAHLALLSLVCGAVVDERRGKELELAFWTAQERQPAKLPPRQSVAGQPLRRRRHQRWHGDSAEICWARCSFLRAMIELQLFASSAKHFNLMHVRCKGNHSSPWSPNRWGEGRGKEKRGSNGRKAPNQSAEGNNINKDET